MKGLKGLVPNLTGQVTSRASPFGQTPKDPLKQTRRTRPFAFNWTIAIKV